MPNATWCARPLPFTPRLNQLLCFATFAGGWKEIEPRQTQPLLASQP